MRSLLLVPLDDASAIDAAFASGADALLLDLAGAGGAREAARGVARDVLRSAQLATARPHLFLRLQDLDAEEIDQDLATVMIGEPDGIFLAASRSGLDIQQLGAKLAVHEAEYGLSDGETSIVAEAAAQAGALFTLGTYAGVSPRLVGLAWNADRLGLDLGGHGDTAGGGGFAPLDTARHLTLFAARAAEVAAIDSASLARTAEALLAECRSARQHGFNAKLATTAAEVEIITAVFGHEGT